MTSNIALLAEKLKDHYKAVWVAIENTQRNILVGVT